jgi:citrate synthase
MTKLASAARKPKVGRQGLDDVVVARTALSDIDGRAGRLVYRGHDAVALARSSGFEDVWRLLHEGIHPADEAFRHRTAALRTVPLPAATLAGLARAGGPFMARLQAALAATAAAWDVRPWLAATAAETEELAVRTASVVPTLVAGLWRLAHGRAVVTPDPTLGHAADYLRMLDGTPPAAERVRGLQRYLVLTAEHSLNASTFTARVVASTGADVVSAVSAAAGALAGPLHGGAPSLVLDMLDAIGTPERAASWIDEALGAGRRLMGFGHRVYRAEDPRAACLRETAETLGGPRVALARAVETVALERLRATKPGRALHTNVEFWSAVVLERVGIPRVLFTPTFCLSRTVGWTAHVREQIADNRLIRPAAQYVGPPVPPMRDAG